MSKHHHDKHEPKRGEDAMSSPAVDERLRRPHKSFAQKPKFWLRLATATGALLAALAVFGLSGQLASLREDLQQAQQQTASQQAAATDWTPMFNDRHQAVFLSNDQVFFCKLSQPSPNYVLCDDAFYLKVKEGEDSNAEQQLNLTRLGQSELHQPEAALKIPPQTILFVEDIRPEAEILKAIENFQRPENQG